ncbi:MAG: 3,4-dihydroxy-2-butanone-4-phosphate synthase [Methylacidiphilales bacterium]|nr:3,4-dihydroxy-2-butanone-4-phosphate synthase [Candidatus Methylacidiphilales bacterium]MDW8349823.1 3,4-dihydroxy-2-butanone-4-phosphate synthase [Verrucomicrobiae bacterium]
MKTKKNLVPSPAQSSAILNEKRAVEAPSLIEDILSALRKGEMVIVTDDVDRENEGDLVMAASKVTPQAVNFMARHGRGLICVPMRRERAESLRLRPMVEQNREGFQTDFTVSVDAAKGITTGISAADRAKTIRLLASPEARAEDFVQPGHVFPLQARPGGVLQRAGHTEAAVDLMLLAGLPPVGVICEILNEDGTMARQEDLKRFQKLHRLKMCSIGDIVRYRRQKESLIECVHTDQITTRWGTFTMKVYRSKLDGQEHIAMIKGKVDPEQPVLVRVHSEDLLNDLFLQSARGKPTTTLEKAMSKIARARNGVLLYLRRGGCTRGELSSISPYLRRPGHSPSYEESRSLRDYGLGAQILYDLGVRELVLLTNHPKKVIALEGYGLRLISQRPL